jgi:hypothetical protein
MNTTITSMGMTMMGIVMSFDHLYNPSFSSANIVCEGTLDIPKTLMDEF